MNFQDSMGLKMNCVRITKIAFLLALLVASFGCKSKEEKPAVNSGAPQQSAAPAPAPAGAPQEKAAVPVASPQDMADARAAALKVLAQMGSGDFGAVYRSASPAFKQIGPEDAFVGKFRETRQKTGELKNPKEVKFDTRPDHIHVLVYGLENVNFLTEMRLSFDRDKSGKMELVGMNQHDEPKAKPKK